MTISFTHWRPIVSAAWILCGAAVAQAATSAQTEQRFLSGHGPKDAVPWEFCVTGGRRAGEWTTIPVPSNWEQQGFGTYNYGQEPVAKADEHGLYRLRFPVPAEWTGRRIRLVFDGVMTDATVKVNGRLAGPVHQGAFYRFRHDITALVNLGADNLLEVDVAKVSANAETERAERFADYWVFGGIFRPVWLEAVPQQSIEHAALAAGADGRLEAVVTLDSVREADRIEAQVLDAAGQPVGAPFSAQIPGGGTGRIRLATQIDSPRLWTAETPNLYSLRLALIKGEETLHTVTEGFGFRTFEVRAGAGLFLNGQRILLKGVCRHSFRPETGRTLSREDCYEDARLIKAMNLNAVRLSHYSPDKAFLEACDELGLYVIDELSGWQAAHSTEVGRRLVRELVDRDVNHPSILLWDNGNEGGWNRALDGDFALYDPQNRTVLHPWEAFNGVDTKHYPTYADLVRRLQGPNLVMPTEMIHGLYDGGNGAGLEDYFNAIAASPFGAGGFHWVYADEGIVRTDQGGRVDTFSTYAPDGIVGPHLEKKGSFFTLRDLYSPIQIDTPVLGAEFAGRLTVHNRYDFTALNRCGFKWRLLRYPAPNARKTAPTVLAEGEATAPAIAPHASGELSLVLPANWGDADALSVVATDFNQQELWTWTWATPALDSRWTSPTEEDRSGIRCRSVLARDPRPESRASTLLQMTRPDTDGKALAPADSSIAPAPTSETVAGEILLHAGTTVATFDATNGLLRAVRRGEATFAFANGPRLAFARPAAADDVQWLETTVVRSETDSSPLLAHLAAPQLANLIEIELDYPASVSWAGFKLEISDGQSWKTLYDATRRVGDGALYEFPPQTIAAVRLSNFRRSDGATVEVKRMRPGYQAARFPAAPVTPPTVTTGTAPDPQTGAPVAWLESAGAAGLDRCRWTLQADGTLRLDYTYTLNGEFLYHGITFDHPEEKLETLRWLGEGPYRVWQNRLRGTSLGVHEIARNDIQPGESWGYPEFQGCFAGLRWARFATAAGPFTVTSAQPETYLRVGTPRISHGNTTVAFPAGDLSFLRAIPAIGSKFVIPANTGPASQPARATGEYSGTLLFRFGD